MHWIVDTELLIQSYEDQATRSLQEAIVYREFLQVVLAAWERDRAALQRLRDDARLGRLSAFDSSDAA